MDDQLMDGIGLFDNLEVLDVTSSHDWVAELSERVWGTSSVPSDTPFVRMLGGLRTLRCATVVVERQYFDEDFLDVFRAFYCRSLTEYPRDTIRLHFFSTVLRRTNLVCLTNEQRRSYLGFMILPQVGGFLVGRAILKPWHDDGHYEYVTCKTRFRVNLSGNPLMVDAAPFIQQDTNVNVCAGASLWSVSHYMWNEHGHKRFYPAQITDLATRYQTLGQCSRGLTSEQVMMAMRKMGYSPCYFPNAWPDAPQRIAATIHAYIESGIPVVALLDTPLGGHAVTVVGHDFRPPAEPQGVCEYNSEWVTCFYIQDDGVGPYQELTVRNCAGGLSVQRNLVGILVPAPPAVAMHADSVAQYSADLARSANDLIRMYTTDEDALIDDSLLQGLMRRTYLSRSNHFKVDVGLAFDPVAPLRAMSTGFAAIYRSMRMPKYIWVTELSAPQLLGTERGEDRRILGEILIDSTASVSSTPLEALLAIHIGGRMIAKAPMEPLGYRVLIDDAEEPYTPLLRQPSRRVFRRP